MSDRKRIQYCHRKIILKESKDTVLSWSCVITNFIYILLLINEVRIDAVNMICWLCVCVTCHECEESGSEWILERQGPRPWLGWHGDMILPWFMLIKIIPTTLPRCHRTSSSWMTFNNDKTWSLDPLCFVNTVCLACLATKERYIDICINQRRFYHRSNALALFLIQNLKAWWK